MKRQLLKSMKYKKADTKLCCYCEIISFPPKSSERVTHNCLFHMVSYHKPLEISSCVRPAPRIFAGNLLFHDKNAVFVSAFLHFMDFSKIVKHWQSQISISIFEIWRPQHWKNSVFLKDYTYIYVNMYFVNYKMCLWL